MGRRIPGVRQWPTPCSSVTRTLRSPAAATSSCRNIFTILPHGMHSPPKRRSALSAVPSFLTLNWTTPSSQRQPTTRSPPSSRTGKRSRSCATTCPSAVLRMVNLAPISSATAVRHTRSSKCWRTCSSVGRPATTTGCSTSAAPSLETCSSFRRRRFWKTPPKTKRLTISLRMWNLPQHRLLPKSLHPYHRRATVRSASVLSKETYDMNNLHRELAPISDSAWAQIEEETSRTLKRYLAGRRVVDLKGPTGTGLSAVGTGHLRTIATPAKGMVARQREVKALVELRVPFDLDRQAIDDVERGANDSDWQPAKDAARQIAFAEDRAIFDGYAAAGIQGIRQGTSNPVMALPADARAFPEAIAQALSQLRLVGVDGPYCVLLGADSYTALAETSDQGYPVLQHIKRLVDSEIVWAPAIAGAFVLSTRGGDFDLHIGQDTSIGYLSHTDAAVTLYLQETFTFLLLTTEAAVALMPAASGS